MKTEFPLFWRTVPLTCLLEQVQQVAITAMCLKLKICLDYIKKDINYCYFLP